MTFLQRPRVQAAAQRPRPARHLIGTLHLGSTNFGDADSDTRVLPFATFCAELPLP